MANYYGSVNVGGGWGPPPLNAGLLSYYNELANQGVGKLAGMVGGAIGGGIAAAKPTQQEMSDWYERADNSPRPGWNFGRGMKGALVGAAEEADPELKRRNQEYQALQKYAEAAHGVPKDQTTPMGLDELRGLVRGYEFKTVQEERLAQRDLEKQRNDALNTYYNRIMDERAAGNRQTELEFKTSQDWQSAYAKGVQQHGDQRRAIAEANAAAPGGMPAGVASDLIQQPVPDPRIEGYKSAYAAAVKAEQEARSAMVGEVGKPVGGENYVKLLNAYTNATLERQKAEKRLMDLANPQGGTADGGQPQTQAAAPSAANRVNVIHPDGRPGTILESDLKEALRQGYRRAN